MQDVPDLGTADGKANPPATLARETRMSWRLARGARSKKANAFSKTQCNQATTRCRAESAELERPVARSEEAVRAEAAPFARRLLLEYYSE